MVGIRVPIIPGLKPISKIHHITFFQEYFKVSIPEKLLTLLGKCTTDKEVQEVGFVVWVVVKVGAVVVIVTVVVAVVTVVVIVIVLAVVTILSCRRTVVVVAVLVFKS